VTFAVCFNSNLGPGKQAGGFAAVDEATAAQSSAETVGNDEWPLLVVWFETAKSSEEKLFGCRPRNTVMIWRSVALKLVFH